MEVGIKEPPSEDFWGGPFNCTFTQEQDTELLTS